MAANSRAFERSAGAGAILVGILGVLYSVAFVIIARASPDTGHFLSALFLLVGGVIAASALAAVYGRLREVDAGFALVGYSFGLIGALGSAVHGAYDLAIALHSPAGPTSDLPSAIDPRGFLTFGLAGVGLLVVSGLMSRGGGFPAGLAWLGYLSGALLGIIYLGRLVVLDATSPLILGPAALEGFVVNPVWYVWLGVTLWRNEGA